MRRSSAAPAESNPRPPELCGRALNRARRAFLQPYLPSTRSWERLLSPAADSRVLRSPHPQRPLLTGRLLLDFWCRCCPVNCISFVDHEDLVTLETERDNSQVINPASIGVPATWSVRMNSLPPTKAKLGSGGSMQVCNNCPSRGCRDCPMCAQRPRCRDSALADILGAVQCSPPAARRACTCVRCEQHAHAPSRLVSLPLRRPVAPHGPQVRRRPQPHLHRATGAAEGEEGGRRLGGERAGGRRGGREHQHALQRARRHAHRRRRATATRDRVSR